MNQTCDNGNSGVQLEIFVGDTKIDGQMNTNDRLVWVELEKLLGNGFAI
ncbi:hypothetical protein ACJIZ3_023784 [Penstemon smallii]|uniref:Uncharacterized protein n=1 Tax=Penstemon smallii TaxID=265156 RepID=A0ABD3TT32_9LAMI